MPLSRRARIDYEDKELKLLKWHEKRIAEEKMNRPPCVKTIELLEKKYKRISSRIEKRGKIQITPFITSEDEKKLHYIQYKLRHRQQISKKESAFLFSFTNIDVIKPATARAPQGVKQLHDVKQKQEGLEVSLPSGE